MPSRKLKEFLDKEGVKYVIIYHSQAFTAPEIAASAHVPGDELAKTVIVKLNGGFAMVVEPAHRKVDLEKLKKETGRQVDLASESEFKGRFPECEIGAMPPFGGLYDMDVFIDEKLSKNEFIAFNAGSHTELIKMKYADFERLVRPKVLK